MDPTRPGDQAEALAATRRILARLKLEILGDEDAPPGVFTGEDRELLEGDTAERQARTCGCSLPGTQRSARTRTPPSTSCASEPTNG